MALKLLRAMFQNGIAPDPYDPNFYCYSCDYTFISLSPPFTAYTCSKSNTIKK